MRRTSVMLIAGDPSGDASAAELATALARAITDAQFHPTDEVQPLETPLAPRFFGAGGPRLAAAGVELAYDMTADSVIGFDAVKKYRMFRQRFHRLVEWAVERQPEFIVLVDFGYFNLRFASAIRQYLRAHAGPFFNWRPKIIYFIPPQVWASRPWRATRLARDFDLLLCLFPFEKAWYAKNAPQLRVEFVGHPIFDRYPRAGSTGDSPVPVGDPPTERERSPELQEEPGFEKDAFSHSAGRVAQRDRQVACATLPVPPGQRESPVLILLLPGSRRPELKRHLAPMLAAARAILARTPVRFEMILPNDRLAEEVRGHDVAGLPLEIRVGELAQSLPRATLAIAKTGTVTLECAYWGVPTVAIYKTSGITYLIGKQVVKVPYLAMPNILAGREVFPELIQGAATGANIAQKALELLENPARREEVKVALREVISSLGGPGAIQRAANAIVSLED